MKPIIFPPDETAFETNGLGRIDPIKCVVTEFSLNPVRAPLKESAVNGITTIFVVR